MKSRILAVLAITLLTLTTAACKKPPVASEVTTTDGSVTTDRPLARNDVIFDNDMTAGNGAPGSQEDLAARAGDRVFFDTDSSELNGESRAVLEKQSQWLQQYANVGITIEGHADERGTREYNLALGERRAQAVKNYLVSLGVPESRLNTISYGKERPAVMGYGEEAWSKNRRGVTVVQ